MVTKNWTLISSNTDYNTVVDGTNECNIVSTLIYNNNDSESGYAKVKIVDSDGNTKAVLFNIEVQAEDTIILDSKIFINSGDQIQVQSTITDLHFTLSGTEG